VRHRSREPADDSRCGRHRSRMADTRLPDARHWFPIRRQRCLRGLKRFPRSACWFPGGVGWWPDGARAFWHRLGRFPARFRRCPPGMMAGPQDQGRWRRVRPSRPEAWSARRR
jgi:hypothetical protein